MVVLRNNFEGGPDGTTITTGNSNQTGAQNAFNIVNSSGTGAILKYTSSAVAALSRPTAEYVMQMQTGSTYTTPNVRWTSAMGDQTQVWMRWYTYFTSVGSSANNLTVASIDIFDAPGVMIGLRATSTPYCLYSDFVGGGSPVYMTSTPIVSNTWYRVEFRATCTFSSDTADLYLYADDNADGDTYDDHISITGQFSNTHADGVSLGNNQSTGGQTNIPATYYSGWEVNTTGYPGPAPFRAGKGVPGILTNPICIHTT
jgi:hypothetical protein